jgi:uncharacterized phiE125 gp8 family phage protein
MMNFGLRRISGPAVEPVTVDEVKLHAHIDHAVEDTLIEAWIKTARELAENYQKRAYYTQVWEMIFDGFPTLPLLIPRPPLISIDSLKYYDYEDTETDYDLTNLIIDSDSQPGRICHVYGVTWPAETLREMNAVKIQFTAGYGNAGTTTTDAPDFVVQEIPQSVKDAIILYCTFRNENRAAENDDIPKSFYNLLDPERIFTP